MMVKNTGGAKLFVGDIIREQRHEILKVKTHEETDGYWRGSEVNIWVLSWLVGGCKWRRFSYILTLPLSISYSHLLLFF